MADAHTETAGFFGWAEEPLATDVSDYVSGRLDPLAERDFERIARRDGRVAAAVDHAKAVRRRVEMRLGNRRRGN
ncbi:MAG: hypothetical protein B7Y80_01865 [Hyphomicrobium sp. 32-62-53]|nr:MAG: hypothetical protein B7Z29_02215 [Hyphomicrobium sp. 12-62-95]OYY01495.1 MAG: hypothetical protein B7Y80_01865 [Hyphomicrobium sp. 32-62-53]